MIDNLRLMRRSTESLITQMISHGSTPEQAISQAREWFEETIMALRSKPATVKLVALGNEGVLG